MNRISKSLAALQALMMAIASVPLLGYKTPESPFIRFNLEEEQLESEQTHPFKFSNDTTQFLGEITYEPYENRIRLKGSYYTNHPDIAPPALFSFHVYNEDREPRKLDFDRVPLEPFEDGFIARFNYELPSISLGLTPEERAFFIQFNFVVENEYWLHQKHPEIELPSIQIRNLHVPESFQPIFQLNPFIAPKSSPVKILTITKVSSNSLGELNYTRTVDAIDDKGARIEMKRSEIEESALSLFGYYTYLDEFYSPSEQDLYIKPGFVWDGVEWYSSPNPRKRIHVISPLYFTTITFLFLAGGVLLYVLSIKANTRIVSLPCFAGSSIFFLLGASLTVVSELAFVLLLFTLTSIPVFLNLSIYFKRLLFTFLPLAGLEWYWSYFQAEPSVTIGGFFLSIWLLALLCFPLVIIKSKALAISYSLLIAISSITYYCWLDIYHSFFNDFPSLISLSYSQQVLSLGDSIVALLNMGHYLSFLIWLPAFVFTGGYSSKRSKQLKPQSV